jgi:hypothetical protein
LQELKNKFQFFSCQARNPYSHKAFPRFHAREIIGKNFAACVIFRRRSAGKQREGLPAGTYQEINPSGKPKRKGQGKGKDGKGRERKGRKEGKDSMLLRTYCLTPINILNKREAHAIYQGKPFKDSLPLREE